MITTENLKDLGFINPANDVWTIGYIDIDEKKVNSIFYNLEDQTCSYKFLIKKCESTDDIMKFVESINFLFNLTIKTEEYNPYCELCGGCGEDGCCSHINCFRQLINSPKCEYGETYLNDAKYAREMSHMSAEIFSQLETHEITADQAINDYEVKSNLIFKEIYH
jgi:hypothetical protein